jgi:hypothetical protein
MVCYFVGEIHKLQGYLNKIEGSKRNESGGELSILNDEKIRDI